MGGHDLIRNDVSGDIEHTDVQGGIGGAQALDHAREAGGFVRKIAAVAPTLFACVREECGG